MSIQADRWLRLVAQPKILLPAIITIALLALAFSLVNVGAVVERIRGLALPTLAKLFALALAYLVIKGSVFNFMLRGLGIRIRLRQVALALLIGEACIPVPSGVYLQNYMLRWIGGAGFATSAAATTAMLALEALIVFATLLLLPLPGFAWLRPVAGAFCAFIVLGWIWLARSWRLQHVANRWALRAPGVLRQALIDLFEGLRTLARPRVLIVSVLLVAAYIFVLVTAFLTIGHGLGFAQLSFRQAVNIYFASLAALYLMSGAVSQLGVVEVVGMGAAQALGYNLSEGLAMLVGFRVAWIGSIWLIAIVAALVLRREFRPSTANGGHELAD